MRTRTSGSTSGDWKRSYGASIATPPDERGGQQPRGTYRHRASRRLYARYAIDEDEAREWIYFVGAGFKLTTCAGIKLTR